MRFHHVLCVFSAVLLVSSALTLAAPTSEQQQNATVAPLKIDCSQQPLLMTPVDHSGPQPGLPTYSCSARDCSDYPVTPNQTCSCESTVLNEHCKRECDSAIGTTIKTVCTIKKVCPPGQICQFEPPIVHTSFSCAP